MWKTHSSGIRVSHTGKVANHDGLKVNQKGYLVVRKIVGTVRGNVHIGPRDRKTKRFYVHRLVAKLFLGNKRTKHVNHKDGNKLHNHKKT